MSRKRTTEEDDLEEIRKGFEMFDVDGRGEIDPSELLEAMDAMNIKEKNPFIYEIIESLNSEKYFRQKGGVKLEELVNYVYEKLNDTESNVGLRQNFDVINDRDTDTVSMSTFFTLARDYGDKMTEDEIRYLLEKTQMGGSDLNFDEFYTIMKGAPKSNIRDNNNSLNMSRSSYRNKNRDIYVKKSSNSKNLNDTNPNAKLKAKPVNYEEPSQPSEIQNEGEEEVNQEPEQEIEKPYIENDNNDHHILEEEIITTTKVIKQSNNDIDNYENDNNVIYPSNKEEIESEEKYEIEENAQKSDKKAPLKYSYRKVHIGSTPKYEKTPEERVNLEEEPNNFINNNLNNIEDNNEDKVTKEKKTKITNLPEGGKQIEIVEKTEIVKERPYVRGHRFRFSKKNNEEKENKEDVKGEEENTYYRIKRPRFDQNNKNQFEKVSVNKVEVEENKEVIIPKRYHRRYRDSKVSGNNDNN